MCFRRSFSGATPELLELLEHSVVVCALLGGGVVGNEASQKRRKQTDLRAACQVGNECMSTPQPFDCFGLRR